MRTIKQKKLFFTSLMLLAALAKASFAAQPPSFPGSFPGAGAPPPILEDQDNTITPNETVQPPKKPLVAEETKAPSISSPSIVDTPKEISKPDLTTDEADENIEDPLDIEESPLDKESEPNKKKEELKLDESDLEEPDLDEPLLDEEADDTGEAEEEMKDEEADNNDASNDDEEEKETKAPEASDKAEEKKDDSLKENAKKPSTKKKKEELEDELEDFFNDENDDLYEDDEAALERREILEKKLEEKLKREAEEKKEEEKKEESKTEPQDEEADSPEEKIVEEGKDSEGNTIIQKTEDGKILVPDPFVDQKDEVKDKAKTTKEKAKQASGSVPSPTKKPKNYKQNNVSLSINKKKYRKENIHLPEIRYVEEYKSLLFQSIPVGNLNALRAMVDYFKDVEIKDGEGNTPLIFAIMSENLPSTISLLGMGANPNAQNSYGVSPLHVAAQLSQPDFVNALINRNVDVNIRDINGKTPLMIAAENNNLEILETLVKQGADVSARMKNGNTALHFAAIGGSENATYTLLMYGAEPDIENYKGYTPLMESALVNNTIVPSLLIKAGADTMKKDLTGKTPTQIASDLGYKKVAEVIDSENIRRQLQLDEMIRERKKERQDFTPPATDRDFESKYMPQIKPVLAESSNKMVPMPSFSKEEQQQMLINSPSPKNEVPIYPDDNNVPVFEDPSF